MGNSNSALQQCIEEVGRSRIGFAGFPSSPLTFQGIWVRPYNLDVKVTPAAVVRPRTAEDISSVIKCANTNNVKVQAKSGGHSYANYGLGGVDGAVVIDMINFQEFSMDTNTWLATVGAGTRLGDMAKRLHDAGGRAVPHAACPGIGIGGQATIGGLGSMSRMWGTSLDHIVEAGVVTADGEIRRANSSHNPELLWAVKGAASGFGIVTDFVLQTHPEPGSVVQYQYAMAFGSQSEIAPYYKAWQDLIAKPDLDRRFGSIFIMMPLGALVVGDFYGTEAEFEASGIQNWLPKGEHRHIVLTDWLGSLVNGAQNEGLYLTNLPAPFYAKSLAFRREDLPSHEKIDRLFRWVDSQHKGTLLWFIIFDATGGAIGDVPANATAFAHRDKVLYYQSYAVGLPLLQASKDFITNFHLQVLEACPEAFGTYPGYVDPKLAEPQRQYWDANLPELERVKKLWDPMDLFHNPGSVLVQ
ncbi:hypothetical protein C8A05DRAFT_43537 [Staphylotrichum tortipilum]|uniref:FAD-binding PCMH-type domain-containing protein n=1 Tax=Staphylotrichum tortipilum TaxID=2831512 RepID=A0AAN6MLL4_9PEZI|nr:hypothetical protein C8A05DRAFT_43537 [Staphylotrichum longicolle]